VTPRLGRPITLDDMRTGAPPVVLLSHAYWVNRFGADAGVVGRTVRVNREPATVVGVLPAGFYDRLALWRPARAAIARPDTRIGGTVNGRLRSGLPPDQAARELTEFVRQTDAAAESRSTAGSWCSRCSGPWATSRSRCSRSSPQRWAWSCSSAA